MTEYDAILQDIFDDPSDDLPRMVAADWLEDNGHPLRAEFIRVQLTLHKEEPGYCLRETGNWDIYDKSANPFIRKSANLLRKLYLAHHGCKDTLDPNYLPLKDLGWKHPITGNSVLNTKVWSKGFVDHLEKIGYDSHTLDTVIKLLPTFPLTKVEIISGVTPVTLARHSTVNVGVLKQGSKLGDYIPQHLPTPRNSQLDAALFDSLRPTIYAKYSGFDCALYPSKEALLADVGRAIVRAARKKAGMPPLREYT